MKNALATAAVVVLTACGGGGGDDPAPDSGMVGFWVGDSFSALVAPGGELWLIEEDGGLWLYKGTLAASGGNFSGTAMGYINTPPVAFAFSGTYTAQQFSGTVSALGQSAPIAAAYSSEYDRPAAVADVAGSYNMATGGTVTIDATGALVGVDAGCSYGGTLTPDTGGKNFFRASVNFGPAPCVVPNGRADGVMVRLDANTLIGGMVSGDFGSALYATRQ